MKYLSCRSRAHTLGTGVLLAFCAGAASAQSGAYSDLTLLSSPVVGEGITSGPDGNLWFVSYNADGEGAAVGKLTTYGRVTLYPIPGYGGEGIAAGSDGALWFTERDANVIGRVTTQGATSAYPVLTGSSPYAITAGPDGALWFTLSGAIGTITVTGAITVYQLPDPGSLPDAITAGPDGALWFTDSNINAIGRVTTTGVITEYPIPSGSGPYGIAAGSDGALWFTLGTNQIGRVTTAGVFSNYDVPGFTNGLGLIAAGPDGALWFLLENGSIARITTTGVVTIYKIPGEDLYPQDITAGPDGNMWWPQSGEFGHAPACGVGFSATYTAPTLTMNFDLGLNTSGIFRVLLKSSGKTKVLFEKSGPPVVPPETFSLHASNLGDLGTSTIYASLLSTSGQMLCEQWTTVDITQ